MKKILLAIGVICSILLLVLGGCSMQGKSKKETEKEKMIKLVESDEAKKAYYHWFTYADPKAFTKEGFIQSYKIDRKSIAKNPMSGIDFDIIINDDPDLFITCNINENEKGELKSTSGSISDKLSQALHR